MQKFFLLKTLGIAMLSMITLVTIAILEVAVYAYLISPGHEQAFYEAHAKISGPWVSVIFGFPLFFLVVRMLHKKLGSRLPSFAILYPITYQAIDVIIVASSGDVEWPSFIWWLLLAFAAKCGGAFLAYYRYR